jgi:signal transduction histidine kinase
VRFRVQDRGLGIPEADLPRLFTPFYRSPNAAHITGTGLGLVIAKRCVERHGGDLRVESREGAGTTVTVQLPVYVPGQTEQFIKPPATGNATNP